MKLTHLTFKGLGGYQGQVDLDLTSFELTLIRGVNGAGKSAILDTISWILFDETARSVKKFDWVNEMVKEGGGKIRLEDGARIYEIERKRDRTGKVFLRFDSQENGDRKDISAKTIQETQQLIEQKLGFTYRVFRNSVMFGQGDLLDLALGTDKEKKEIIGDVLGFKEIDLCLSEVRKRMATLKEHEFRVQTSFDVQSREFEMLSKISVSEISLFRQKQETLEKKVSALQGEEKKVSESLEQLLEQSKTKDQIKVLEESVSLEPALKEKFTLLREQEKKSAGLQNQIAALNREREGMRDELQKHTFQEDSLLKEVSNLERKNKAFLSIKGPCPTCHQTLSETKRKEVSQEFLVEIDKDKGELKKIGEIKSLLQKTLEGAVEELKVIEGNWSSIVITLKSLPVIEKDLAEVRESKKQLEELRKRVVPPEVSTGIEGIQQRLTSLQEQIKSLLADRVEVTVKLSSLQESLQRKRKIGLELSELEKELSEISSDLKHLSFLENLFSLKGVRNKILENVIPFMEREVNSYLSMLFPGVSLTFSTERQGKTVMRSEFTLNLKDLDTGVVRDFRAWSGGEKMLVSLALRFMLWKVSHLFSKNHLEVLFLDEIFGCLDESYREKVLEFLREQQRELQVPIFVVEHIPDVQEEFVQVLNIKKTENGSVVDGL